MTTLAEMAAEQRALEEMAAREFAKIAPELDERNPHDAPGWTVAQTALAAVGLCLGYLT